MVELGSDRPEVFVALIAPIGINLEQVQDELCAAFQRVNYNPNIIKLTKFLEEHPEWFDLKYDSDFDRYKKYIAAGNKFCNLASRRDAMILGGLAQLYRDYIDRPESVAFGTAHIFRQIKRTEEIDTLRQIYGRNIIFLGCYAPRKIRVKNLVSLLLKNQRGVDINKLEAEALEIIGIDEMKKM